jgi:hypothetical protein
MSINEYITGIKMHVNRIHRDKLVDHRICGKFTTRRLAFSSRAASGVSPDSSCPRLMEIGR